jgi:hypothetical protein
LIFKSKSISWGNQRKLQLGGDEFMDKFKKYAATVAFGCCLSIGAHAKTTPNFEFVVKAQSGLRLVITGYGKAGQKIFSKSVSTREPRVGGAVYVIRVDENIIFKNGVGKVCVQDKNKKWERQKKDGKFSPEMICDSSPTDNKGSYLFGG